MLTQKELLKGKIVACQEQIAKFKHDFEVNPLYAFGWADSKIEAAARMDQLILAMDDLDHGKTVEQIKEWLLKEIVREAQYHINSTSACTMIVETAKREAKAWLYEYLTTSF